MKELRQDYFDYWVGNDYGEWVINGKRYPKYDDPYHSWHEAMPKELWTEEARQLFRAAEEADLLTLIWEADPLIYVPGRRIKSKWQMALWCKLASKYLELDSALGANWAPFEKVFNSGHIDWLALAGRKHKECSKPTPLRASLSTIIVSEDDDNNDRQVRVITDFFAEFEKGRNPSNCDLNNQDEEQ